MQAVILKLSKKLTSRYTEGILFFRKRGNKLERLISKNLKNKEKFLPIRWKTDNALPADSYCIEIGAECIFETESTCCIIEKLCEIQKKYTHYFQEKIHDHKEILCKSRNLLKSMNNLNEIQSILPKIFSLYLKIESQSPRSHIQVEILLIICGLLYFNNKKFNMSECVIKALFITEIPDFFNPLLKYHTYRAAAFVQSVFKDNYQIAIKCLENAFAITELSNKKDLQVDALVEILNHATLYQDIDRIKYAIRRLELLFENNKTYLPLQNLLSKIEAGIPPEKISVARKYCTEIRKEIIKNPDKYFTVPESEMIFCIKNQQGLLLTFTIPGEPEKDRKIIMGDRPED